MKISHFFFSRRVIPIKHFQNASSILEAFPFIRYILLYGPSQLLIIKSNLKRGGKKPKHSKSQPCPQAHRQYKMKARWSLGSRKENATGDGEESRLVTPVAVEGGDPGVKGHRCASVLQTQPAARRHDLAHAETFRCLQSCNTVNP